MSSEDDSEAPPPPGTPAPLDENGNAYRTKWKTIGGPEDGDMVNRPLPPKGGWPADYVPKPGPKRKLTNREMEQLADRIFAKARLKAAREYAKVVSAKADNKRANRRAADMTLQDKFVLAAANHHAAAQRTREAANAPKMLGVVVLPAQRAADDWERMAASDPKVIEAHLAQELPQLPAKKGEDGDDNQG
jgi:hypothetical protein